MKKILSVLVLGAFIFGVSANLSTVQAKNFEPVMLASSADKDKQLDEKLRKQAEKKRAEQLERKAKAE